MKLGLCPAHAALPGVHGLNSACHNQCPSPHVAGPVGPLFSVVLGDGVPAGQSDHHLSPYQVSCLVATATKPTGRNALSGPDPSEIPHHGCLQVWVGESIAATSTIGPCSQYQRASNRDQIPRAPSHCLCSLILSAPPVEPGCSDPDGQSGGDVLNQQAEGHRVVPPML